MTKRAIVVGFGSLVANGLVGVVSLAVAEEIVDDHAANREDENDERPDDLVGGGAVRLEDLDCSTDTSVPNLG